jgi:hypothetical protein
MKDQYIEFTMGIIVGALAMLIIYPGIFIWVMMSP